MASRTDRSRFRTLFSAPLAAVVLMWIAWPTDLVRELENVTVDWRFKARAESDPPPDPRIVLIGVGEKSLKEIGRWEDWSRNEHAKLLDALTHRPPRVVAWDFFFTEPSANLEDDENFGFALANHPGSITGMFVDLAAGASDLGDAVLTNTAPFPHVSGADITGILGGTSALVPIPTVEESSWTATVNFPPSRVDGIRRRYPLVVRIGTNVYPSLALQILLQLEEKSPGDVKIALGEAVTIPRADGGEWRIPIDERGFFTLNYRDTSRFGVYDYYLVREQLDAFSKGTPWPDQLPSFQDQIVLIGQSAEGLADFGPTPYRPQEALFLVQATALDSILREDFIHEIPVPFVLSAWLAIALLTLFALRGAPVSVAIVVPVAVTAIVVTAAFVLFLQFSLLVPLVLPVVGFVLIHTVVIGDRLVIELREKRYIKGMFGSYVSPAVVNQIVDSEEPPKLGGEEVDLSILFTDIQGFSTFSEALEPTALVDLMVEYLSEMTDIVTDAGGTLDKYIGDAIDAMFGAPVPLPDHAYIAVRAAIEMQRKQEEFRLRWTEQGRSEMIRNMRTRIGLNTGPAVVGNIGSKRRFNYTMMGDNVNLAARLESGGKQYGVYSMATEDTMNGAIATRDDVVYRYLDRIIVKGRTLPVRVYEILETRDRVNEATLHCLAEFDKAMNRYLAQDWDGAKSGFEEAARLEPLQPGRDPGISTNPSRVMAARCSVMKATPPGDAWDGVYAMSEK